MKLTPQQLEAVVGLLHNRDFGVVMQAIASHCSYENERLLKLPEGNEYLRGQVFAFSDLLEAINTAPKNLEKAKQPKS